MYIYIGGGAGGAQEGLPGHEKGVETQKNVNDKFTPAQMCKEMAQICKRRPWMKDKSEAAAHRPPVTA